MTVDPRRSGGIRSGSSRSKGVLGAETLLFLRTDRGTTVRRRHYCAQHGVLVSRLRNRTGRTFRQPRVSLRRTDDLIRGSAIGNSLGATGSEPAVHGGRTRDLSGLCYRKRESISLASTDCDAYAFALAQCHRNGHDHSHTECNPEPYSDQHSRHANANPDGYSHAFTDGNADRYSERHPDRWHNEYTNADIHTVTYGNADGYSERYPDRQRNEYLNADRYPDVHANTHADRAAGLPVSDLND